MDLNMDADKLVKLAEEARRLRKLGNSAISLAATISGKDEMELLSESVNNDLPVLYLNLCKRRQFFVGKSEGMLKLLDKDINIVDGYLKSFESPLTIEQLTEINRHIYTMNDKYSFDV